MSVNLCYSPLLFYTNSWILFIPSSLIHVITPDPDAMRPLIEAALQGAGIEIHTIERIAPSLEDVFIASVQSQSEDRLYG